MPDHTSNDLDQDLSALLDGELDAIRALELREAMAADAALAARYAELAAANRAYAEAMRSLDDVPLPPALRGRLEEAPPGEVVALGSRVRAPATAWPLAVAATVALVVGFAAAQLVGPLLDGAEPEPLIAGSGVVGPRSPLHGVLEDLPSGTVEPLPGGSSAAALQSFLDHAERYCRELQWREAAGTHRAVACREGAEWHVQVVAFAERDAVAGYRVASTTASLVDDAVAAMRRGESLDAAAEARLLGNWR